MTTFMNSFFFFQGRNHIQTEDGDTPADRHEAPADSVVDSSTHGAFEQVLVISLFHLIGNQSSK